MCTETIKPLYTRIQIMDRHLEEVMIFTSKMALDLQQVLTQILVTPIVLQVDTAMAAATQGRFWLVVTMAS